jgi:hypothetical protein
LEVDQYGATALSGKHATRPPFATLDRTVTNKISPKLSLLCPFSC